MFHGDVGGIAAAICDGITRSEQEFMGREPNRIQTHLVGDLVVVRVEGVLTAAEQHLVKSLTPENGRGLLKQVRRELLESGRAIVEEMVREVTGVKVLSMQHDISTVTGEKIVVFTLAKAPQIGEPK